MWTNKFDSNTLRVDAQISNPQQKIVDSKIPGNLWTGP